MSKLCECGCGQETPLAYKTIAKQGWKKGEPLRFINGHNRRKGAVDYLEEDRGHATSCWIWQRARSSRGYGVINRQGYKGSAHRWFYEQKFGPITEGHELDHLCRVRECCNPDHMEPVTPEVNRQRGANAKVTPAIVHMIRNSTEPSRAIAARLGVTHTCVNDIRSGRRWGNV